MKILQAHNYFYLVGGAEKYFFDLAHLLSDKGHDLGYFSMEDNKNKTSIWKKYFISNISFENRSFISKIRLAQRIIYSVEARKKLSQLLKKYNPQIVHIHDLSYFISPSILPLINKENIPIVQTIHNYNQLGLTSVLFHNGARCEITKVDKYYKGLFHRCVSDSYLATMVQIVAKYVDKAIGLYNTVKYFITPSIFTMDKMIEYGISQKRIIHIPYFIDYKLSTPNYEPGNYILYFGRLSEEKGLDILINSMKKLPNIRLKIAGIGLEFSRLKKISPSNVEFIGFHQGKSLKRIIYGSRFTILPSVWFEVAPLSILESFSCGKPMISSNIGGITEIIKDGINGFLFKPGDKYDLIENIQKLWSSPILCKEMGKNARNNVEKNFGPKQHYEKIMEVYLKATRNV